MLAAGGQDDSAGAEVPHQAAAGAGRGPAGHLRLEVRRHGDRPVLSDRALPLHPPHHRYPVRLCPPPHRSLIQSWHQLCFYIFSMKYWYSVL